MVLSPSGMVFVIGFYEWWSQSFLCFDVKDQVYLRFYLS